MYGPVKVTNEVKHLLNGSQDDEIFTVKFTIYNPLHINFALPFGIFHSAYIYLYVLL